MEDCSLSHLRVYQSVTHAYAGLRTHQIKLGCPVTIDAHYIVARLVAQLRMAERVRKEQLC